ncbi:hypothetical protein CABS01_16642 [Colletotrichum abscissum]|uniref:Uncharacterized protein n=1 Tax=Colletotrichum tamarilloi TaxID=1209934 RepID=A0ABQ9QGT0_9PEZI|nr:uncharacterized protein CTAM01_17041 [Colletotrichum tamarilloi]XP_060404539.1 uncharacterized protein CABS01_16642 [Colletotrichum abscissum]KAK1466157.1 hypothetical protein CTAM01_17041 [Colletotrichum tamarilloi]KAK1517414.1 hypothetical protein CABS01_16642 [Colletotrichum abscissum]
MDGNDNHHAAVFASASASPGVEETQTSNLTSMPPATRAIYEDFRDKLESLRAVISKKGDEDDLDDALTLARALRQLTAPLMSTIKQEGSAVFREETSDTAAGPDWLEDQRS